MHEGGRLEGAQGRGEEGGRKGRRDGEMIVRGVGWSRQGLDLNHIAAHGPQSLPDSCCSAAKGRRQRRTRTTPRRRPDRQRCVQ